MLSSIPTSLIFLGGKSILKSLGSESSTGVLGSLCDLVSRVNDSLVYGDFQRIQKRRKIHLNGHLHLAYIHACEESIKQLQKEFKANNDLGFSLQDWISDSPSERKIILQILEDISEKINQVFKQPANIEYLFDQQFQISGGDQFFTHLLDLMISNGKGEDESGKKRSPVEPFIAISKKRFKAFEGFFDSFRVKFSQLFQEYFIKELKANETARHAYTIHMQHALFLKQSEFENSVLKDLEYLTRPPLLGLIPQVEKSGMDYFAYPSENTAFVGRNKEIIHLKNFLNDQEKFRWLLITGEGGSGKSRLAYELCKDAYDGGWEVGFYQYDNDEHYSFNKFKIKRNTLIVFDYIGEDNAFQKVSNAIKSINVEVSKIKLIIEKDKLEGTEAQRITFPKIRFILLERFLLDYQLNALNDQKIRNNFYPEEKKTDFSNLLDGGLSAEEEAKGKVKPYKLGRMGDDEKWNLIQQVAGDKVTASSKENIIKQIATIDPLKRPLFIFMSAFALRDNNTIEGWDRNKMLDWHVDRMETKLWQKHKWYNLNRRSLKNIIWLATMTSYLQFDEKLETLLLAKTKQGYSCFGFPKDENLVDELASLFHLVGDRTEYEKYYGIQPDIVAEYFLISYVAHKDGKNYYKDLLQIALENFPNRSVEMLIKIARDFISHPGFIKIRDHLFLLDYPVLGKVFYSMSYQYLELKKHSEAIKFADKTIVALKESTIEEDQFYTKNAYCIKGIGYKRQGQFETALKFMDEAIKMDDKYAVGFYHRWEVYQILGNIEKARADFKSAVQFDLNSVERDIQLLASRFSAGEYERDWFLLNLTWIKRNVKQEEAIHFLLPLMAYSNGNETLEKITRSIKTKNAPYISTQELDFYPGYFLHQFSLSFEQQKDLTIRIIADASDNILLFLNGTAGLIHELNRQITVKLNTSNVAAYLDFFMQNMSANEGAFQLVNPFEPNGLEWIEDPNGVLDKEVYLNYLKDIHKELNDLQVNGDNWLIEKIVFYAGDLFLSVFNVLSNGYIEMVQDVPLTSKLNLPIKKLHTIGCFYKYFDQENCSYVLEAKSREEVLHALQIMRGKVTIDPTKSKERADYVKKLTILDAEWENGVVENSIVVNLPFYPSTVAYQAEERKLNNGKKYFKRYLIDHAKSNGYSLNSTSPPIHEINALAPINLDAKVVADYLRFFCENVHGDQTAFYFIESIEEVKWNRGVDETEKEKYLKFISLVLKEIDTEVKEREEEWFLERIINFGGTIFKAQFKVDEYGVVVMLDDFHLAYNLPISYLGSIGPYFTFKESMNKEAPQLISYVSASFHKELTIMKWIYENHDKDINQKSKVNDPENDKSLAISEYTALETNAFVLAAFLGDEAIIDWLLSLDNLEIDFIDDEGKSALDRAIERGHDSIVEKIRNYKK